MNPPGTANEEAQRRLRQTERLLACLQTALGHELPNQLVAIQGLARLLDLEEGARLGPEGRDYLQRLAGAARRMHGLIHELAELLRAVRERDADTPAVLADVVREAVAEIKQLLSGQLIDYHLALPNCALDLPPRALRQVLLRLLRQAAADQPADGVLHVEVGAHVLADAVTFWVADDGPARSEAGQRLLEPFAAGGMLPAGPDELGLFACSVLVEGWGGTLEVDSEAGRGNRYTVMVPTTGIRH